MEDKLKILSELALDLAIKEGFESVSLYVKYEWKEFIIFEAHKHDISDFPEYLPLILVKNEKARWANKGEAEQITILYE